MIASGRSIAATIAAMTLVGSAVTLLGQTGNETQDAGSFAALTAEIHQLRLAVEESTRTQTQTQVLSVALSAQQARLVHASTRADSARKELDALTAQSSEITDQLANLAENIDRSANPDQRTAMEQEVRALKQMQRRIALQEQQARGREAELSQLLDVENARWTDLVSRLEQMVKR